MSHTLQTSPQQHQLVSVLASYSVPVGPEAPSKDLRFSHTIEQ